MAGLCSPSYARYAVWTDKAARTGYAVIAELSVGLTFGGRRGDSLPREKAWCRKKRFLPAPKEYRRSADSVIVEAVFPDDAKTPRAPDKVTPDRKVLENEEIIVVEPETEKIPAAEPGEPDPSREQGSTSSTESPLPTAFAGTKVELHTHPRIERDPGQQFLPENAKPGAKSAEGSGDLVIGQEGCVIGDFRSREAFGTERYSGRPHAFVRKLSRSSNRVFSQTGSR